MGKEWGYLRPRKASRRTALVSCQGKEPFDSFSLATEIAKQRSRHGKKNHVYRCAGCEKFHLGSAKPRSVRPRLQLIEVDIDL